MSHNCPSISKKDVKQLQATISLAVYASYTVARKLELFQLPSRLCCLYFYFCLFVLLFVFSFVHSFIHLFMAHQSIFFLGIKRYLNAYLALSLAPSCKDSKSTFWFPSDPKSRQFLISWKATLIPSRLCIRTWWSSPHTFLFFFFLYSFENFV